MRERRRSRRGATGVAPLRRPGRAAGFTLFEALVALILTSAAIPAIWSLLGGGAATARRAGARGERLDLVRTSRVVLGWELRAGVPGRDWSGPAADSLPLRAFRGLALPCGGDAGGEMRVLYRGLRLPEPAKDSVLVLREDGSWRPGALRSARPEAPDTARCAGPGGDGRILRVRADGVDEGMVLARIYERGSYHLHAGALRYRRGRSGRQPLTPSLLDDARSGLARDLEGGPVRLRLAFDTAESGDRPSSWSLEIWPRDR